MAGLHFSISVVEEWSVTMRSAAGTGLVVLFVANCTQRFPFGFLLPFQIFPSETVADSWNNSLTQLIAFVGMSTPVFEALVREFGDFNDRITNVATIPEKVYREGVSSVSVIIQAYVAATDVQPEVPERTRPFFPVEIGQAGLLWRIAQRIYWKLTGKAWEDFPTSWWRPPRGRRCSGREHHPRRSQLWVRHLLSTS